MMMCWILYSGHMMVQRVGKFDKIKLLSLVVIRVGHHVIAIIVVLYAIICQNVFNPATLRNCS